VIRKWLVAVKEVTASQCVKKDTKIKEGLAIWRDGVGKPGRCTNVYNGRTFLST
jgi:hypothetical protein